MSTQKIILIAGPTASGKSALALDLAQKMQGTIINADAMQIYSGLPILTAQTSAEEQEKSPHLLYGVTDPSEASSAGKWLALAQQAIRETLRAGRTPILVGGTGLYFRALLGGLADIPEIPIDVRDRAQKFYAEAGEEQFREELRKIDSENATRLAKNDRQRLVRAYEVAVHTGKPLKYWQEQGAKAGLFKTEFPELDIEPHLLMPQREELYAACDKRFEKMIERGALKEVEQFLERKLDPDLPAMKTLGLRELASVLSAEMTLEEAISKAQQATRNYAKRQMTWFRNQWAFEQQVTGQG